MLSARKIHRISLTAQELHQVTTLIRKGTANARVITRARILQMAHHCKIDKEIYVAPSRAVSPPYDIRKRYTKGGLTRALYDLPRPGQKRKLTEIQEAEVVAIACTKALLSSTSHASTSISGEIESKAPVPTTIPKRTAPVFPCSLSFIRIVSLAKN